MVDWGKKQYTLEQSDDYWGKIKKKFLVFKFSDVMAGETTRMGEGRNHVPSECGDSRYTGKSSYEYAKPTVLDSRWGIVVKLRG
jgi:hypothetical protein